MSKAKFAMILAAGRGERLRPLTDSTPKPLLKAGDHRLIEHHLYSLARAGYSDIVINIGHLGQQIMDELGDGSRYQLCIHYSDERGAVLETGGGIFKALPLLKSEPFLVINGDIWTDIDLRTLPSSIASESHLILTTNPSHNPEGDFSLDGNLIREKKHTTQAWTYSGIGLFSHKLFSESTAGRFPLAPLLRKRIAEDVISGEVYKGMWFDIGTIERLDALNSLLKSRKEKGQNPF